LTKWKRKEKKEEKLNIISPFFHVEELRFKLNNIKLLYSIKFINTKKDGFHNQKIAKLVTFSLF